VFAFYFRMSEIRNSIRIMKKEILGIFCVFFALQVSAGSFVNYRYARLIRDITETETNVVAASSGGLFKIAFGSDSVEFISRSEMFPDLDLSAVHYAFGSIWVGSKSGYLYKIENDGKYSIIHSYFGSQWGINVIKSIGDYLLIGSPKGLSVFDPKLERAVNNGTRFGTLNTVEILDVAFSSNKDTLYLLLSDGVVKKTINEIPVNRLNLLDHSIWQTEESGSNKSLKSFLFSQNAIKTYFTLAAQYNDSSVVKAESNSVTLEGQKIAEVPSEIQSLYQDSKGNLWIGTSVDYLYRLSGKTLKSFSVNTISYPFINALDVDDDGTVWCVPQFTILDSMIGSTKNIYTPSWQGIHSFDGKEWRLYNQQTEGFGATGDNWYAHGISTGENGNLWFGLSGGGIKKYNKKKNMWNIYEFEYSSQDYFKLVEQNRKWNKVDAIAIDSSGYVWFAPWYEKNPNFLVCSINKNDASINQYRWVIKPDDNRWMAASLHSINVDVYGNVIGGGGAGGINVIKYEKDPFTEDLVVESHPTIPESRVMDMTSTQNGVTWIAAVNGIYRYYNGKIDYIDNNINGVNAICAENNNVVWVGTNSNGLIKLELKEPIYLNRLEPQDVTYFTTAQGLISNQVNSLAINKKNGVLWIGTNKGLSNYNLGHNFKKLIDNKNMDSYPNPFSLSNYNHKQIVFTHLMEGSVILIYSASGELVDCVGLKSNHVKSNQYEWNIIWDVPRKISPGTYFYTAKKRSVSSDLRTNSRARVGKLLIIP